MFSITQKTIYYAIFITMIVINQPANAGNGKVLLELFTSQGCSSCPPADEYIFQLIKRDDVIPIAYHVDYWDYIGWKDPFAKAEYTARQRQYATSWNSRQVYTPQMVVQGMGHAVGSNPKEIEKLITKAKPNYPDITSNIQLTQNKVNITIKGNGIKGNAILVAYLKEQNTAVKNGENNGRTLHEARIVEKLINLGAFNGQNGQYSADLPANAQYGGLVLMVQNPQNMAIIHANELKF